MGDSVGRAAMTKAQARRLTDSIRAHVETAWAQLLEARDQGAWAVLGYRSFEAYAADEFGMSRGNAYRLVAQAEVIQALATAVPELSRARDSSPSVSARQAASLAKQPDAIGEIAAKVKAGAEPAQAVREVVTRTKASHATQDDLQRQLRATVDDLRSVIGTALTRDLLLGHAKRLDTPTPKPKPVETVNGCEHPKDKRKPLNGGRMLCIVCHHVRGVDDRWRQP